MPVSVVKTPSMSVAVRVKAAKLVFLSMTLLSVAIMVLASEIVVYVELDANVARTLNVNVFPDEEAAILVMVTVEPPPALHVVASPLVP
jgi:hypothetical protein